uniref:Uncharacterized protein n=1 Tax=Anguilla anguilla TaxID=7936 RepID=A0A0E9SEK3_ANGAN
MCCLSLPYQNHWQQVPLSMEQMKI